VAGRWKGGVPDDVHGQTAWQMAVTGYGHIHVATLIGGQEFRQFTVRRDLALEATIMAIVDPFWSGVLQRQAPVVDPAEVGDALTELDNVRYPVRDGSVEVSSAALEAFLAYKEAGAQESAGKRAKAAAKATLVQLLGGAEAATVEGKELYTYSPSTRKSCDMAKLAERWPEAFAECVSETTSPTIHLSTKFDPKGIRT